jgi:AcrR family transcriptional regulator
MKRMARDEKLLDAAEQLIYERGLDGVGVDAIGQLADATGQAIYRHVDGKDEILGVLFDRAITPFSSVCVQTTRRGSPVRRELLVRRHRPGLRRDLPVGRRAVVRP